MVMTPAVLLESDTAFTNISKDVSLWALDHRNVFLRSHPTYPFTLQRSPQRFPSSLNAYL